MYIFGLSVIPYTSQPKFLGSQLSLYLWEASLPSVGNVTWFGKCHIRNRQPVKLKPSRSFYFQSGSFILRYSHFTITLILRNLNDESFGVAIEKFHYIKLFYCNKIVGSHAVFRKNREKFCVPFNQVPRDKILQN